MLSPWPAESPSSSASDVDNLNNPSTIAKIVSTRGLCTSQIAKNPISRSNHHLMGLLAYVSCLFLLLIFAIWIIGYWYAKLSFYLRVAHNTYNWHCTIMIHLMLALFSLEQYLLLWVKYDYVWNSMIAFISVLEFLLWSFLFAR